MDKKRREQRPQEHPVPHLGQAPQHGAVGPEAQHLLHRQVDHGAAVLLTRFHILSVAGDRGWRLLARGSAVEADLGAAPGRSEGAAVKQGLGAQPRPDGDVEAAEAEGIH